MQKAAGVVLGTLHEKVVTSMEAAARLIDELSEVAAAAHKLELRVRRWGTAREIREAASAVTFTEAMQAELASWYRRWQRFWYTGRCSSRPTLGRLVSLDRVKCAVVKVLLEHGGELQAARVVELVERELGDHLSSEDRRPMPNNGRPRWLSVLYQARQALIARGILSSRAPRGTWRLVNDVAARRFLDECCGDA